MEINISLVGNSIKQHETAEYLGSQLDSKLSGEAMVSKVLKKINAKLKFLYRQTLYLTPAYKRLLYNALIQPHFDYGCSSWFPLLKKNPKGSKQMQSFLFKFTYEMSYRPIALQKNKLASGQRQSQIIYCECLHSTDKAQDH